MTEIIAIGLELLGIIVVEFVKNNLILIIGFIIMLIMYIIFDFYKSIAEFKLEQ